MKKNIFVLIIFVIIIVVMTFPLVFRILTCIPGFYSTDEIFGTLWDSWRIKYSLDHSISLNNTILIANPFGFDLRSFFYNSFLWLGLVNLLSRFTTPVFTINFKFIVNIILCLYFMYLLVFFLTRNRSVSIFGSIIFAFCPYQFMRLWQHLGLTYNEWIPLIILAAILFNKEKSKMHALLYVVSLVLLLSFDFTVMYLGCVTLATFLAYFILYRLQDKLSKDSNLLGDTFRYIKDIFLLSLIAAIILLPQFFPIIKNNLIHSAHALSSANSGFRRPFEDLFIQSAKPLSYFLPAVVHPIFGKITEQFIGSFLYGVSLTEHTLYLGWIPIMLAVYATKIWGKNRKLRIKKQGIASFDDYYIGFFIFLTVVAWLF